MSESSVVSSNGPKRHFRLICVRGGKKKSRAEVTLLKRQRAIAHSTRKPLSRGCQITSAPPFRCSNFETIPQLRERGEKIRDFSVVSVESRNSSKSERVKSHARTHNEKRFLFRINYLLCSLSFRRRHPVSRHFYSQLEIFFVSRLDAGCVKRYRKFSFQEDSFERGKCKSNQ